MATSGATTHFSEASSNIPLRTRIEELLFDFYSLVGVAPRRPEAAPATDLLADNFQGRFFLQSTSELLCFDKGQIVTAQLRVGDAQRPGSQLINLSLVRDEDGSVSANYAVALRHGQTALLRRGTLKAIETVRGWAIRSVDEDVRVIVLPEPRRRRTAFDQPRVWIR